MYQSHTSNIWIFFLALTPFILVYLNERSARNRVISYLERRGLKDIVVKTRMFGGGRGTITFDVEYTSTTNIKNTNACTVHTGILADDKLYWHKPFNKSHGHPQVKDEEEKEDFYLWS